MRRYGEHDIPAAVRVTAHVGGLYVAQGNIDVHRQRHAEAQHQALVGDREHAGFGIGQRQAAEHGEGEQRQRQHPYRARYQFRGRCPVAQGQGAVSADQEREVDGQGAQVEHAPRQQTRLGGALPEQALPRRKPFRQASDRFGFTARAAAHSTGSLRLSNAYR